MDNKHRFILAALVLVISSCASVPVGQEDRNRRASAVNVELGIGYLQQNNLEAANEKLYKALNQDPDSAKAHMAYAILQQRLLQDDKAEIHYREATELDPSDSQAANAYGAFLCQRNREEESIRYFLRALKNPLYRTPEFAYTNAARCLIKIDRVDEAREYLMKALSVRSDFMDALYTMADLNFKKGDYADAKKYIDEYHMVARPSAATLWFSLENELELGNRDTVAEIGEQLAREFPESAEYQRWLSIQ